MARTRAARVAHDAAEARGSGTVAVSTARWSRARVDERGERPAGTSGMSPMVTSTTPSVGSVREREPRGVARAARRVLHHERDVRARDGRLHRVRRRGR